LAGWSCGRSNGDRRIRAVLISGYRRLHILRRRDEFLHLRRGAVLEHVFEPDAVHARVLILVFDPVAAFLDTFYGQFGDVQTVDEVLQSLERGDKARVAA
jgi:hypothetical protein